LAVDEANGHGSLETLIRVTSALALVGGLEPMFVQKLESIAALQRAAQVPLRQRAPRRSSIGAPNALIT
jgi:hypothetical protein